MTDYNRWKNIEISDDEDDTHPNIDTPSLFRWRHEARVKRMKEFKDKKERCMRDKQILETKLKKCLSDIQAYEAGELHTMSMEKLQIILEETKKEMEENREWEEKLMEEEKSQPLNIDNIHHDVFDGCQITSQARSIEHSEEVETQSESSAPSAAEATTEKSPSPEKPKATSNTSKSLQPKKPVKKHVEETKAPFEDGDEIFSQFIRLNEDKILKFASLTSYKASAEFLCKNIELARESVSNYLCIHCIDLAAESKINEMKIAAHQTICLKLLLDVCKHYGASPEKMAIGFFSKLASGEPQAKLSLNSELSDFIVRVKQKAQERYEKAYKQVEQEERKKRIGPGGLDPVEVFDTLPKEMQECFEKQDIELLKIVVSKMSEADARYHLKRCVDSGLWVPDASEQRKFDAENNKETDSQVEIQHDSDTEDHQPDSSSSSPPNTQNFATSIDDLD